jgi:hypothetical protein
MEITVGAHVVNVMMGDDVDLELAREGKYGDSDVERLTIRVRSDLPNSVRRETVLHEVMHHIWAQTPLAVMFSEEQEEQVIRALSPMLFACGVSLSLSD